MKSDSIGVFLEVVGGGCAGFSYKYSAVDSMPEFDVHHIYDLDGDHYFIVESDSMPFVAGSTLEYVDEIGNSSLVIRNPLEVSSCGCGNSFAV